MTVATMEEGVGVSEEVKKPVLVDDGVVSLWEVADLKDGKGEMGARSAQRAHLAPEETGLDEAGEEEDAESASDEAVVDK